MRTKLRNQALSFTALFAILFAGVLAISFILPPNVAVAKTDKRIAPDFESFHTLDAKTLKPFKNSRFKKDVPTIYAFISIMCPCSKSHAPELNRLAEEYSDVQFIGISSNVDETDKEVQEYLKENNYSFPVVRDQKSKLANYFGATKTPDIFFVDKTGQTVFQGGMSNSVDFARASKNYLGDALSDFKTGHAIRTPLARALGCMITRD